MSSLTRPGFGRIPVVCVAPTSPECARQTESRLFLAVFLKRRIRLLFLSFDWAPYEKLSETRTFLTAYTQKYDKVARSFSYSAQSDLSGTRNLRFKTTARKSRLPSAFGACGSDTDRTGMRPKPGRVRELTY